MYAPCTSRVRWTCVGTVDLNGKDRRDKVKGKVEKEERKDKDAILRR